jgi:hypothetical protein
LEGQLVGVVADLLGMQRAADLVGEDEPAVGPGLACGEAFGGLALAVRAQRADGVLIQGDGGSLASAFGLPCTGSQPS